MAGTRDVPSSAATSEGPASAAFRRGADRRRRRPGGRAHRQFGRARSVPFCSAMLSITVSNGPGLHALDAQSRAALVGSQSSREYLVKRYWKVPGALAGGVVDGVCDGGSAARDANFANAVQAKRRVRVRYVGPDDVDLRYVQVHRHMVLGKG